MKKDIKRGKRGVEEKSRLDRGEQQLELSAATVCQQRRTVNGSKCGWVDTDILQEDSAAASKGRAIDAVFCIIQNGQMSE